MRLVVVVAAFVVAAVSFGSAQTVETTLDLSSLGWGHLDTPMAVETDGDFSTREWLIRSFDTGGYRVVADRGRMCVGPWFFPSNHLFTLVSVQRVGVRHVLVVSPLRQQTHTVIRLDTPSC